MKLTVKLDGQPVPLEFEKYGENWTVNGRNASVLEVEHGIYSVLIDGRSFEARIERTLEAWAVSIGGRRYELEVVDPRRMTRRGAGMAGEARQRISSPMPGKVVRVLVAQDDPVEAGQPLIVVEAMKMQNELKALRAGRIISLTAHPGSTVAAGETLAVIE